MPAKPRLPRIHYLEAVRAFEKLGWSVVRSGNHTMMKKPENPLLVTIPNHKELKSGTLRSLIRDAGETLESFLEALHS